MSFPRGFFKMSRLYVGVMALAYVCVGIPSAHADINHSLEIHSAVQLGYSNKKITNENDASAHWPFGGLARITYALRSLPNKTIRGGVKLSLKGTTAGRILFEIERAYLRIRVPLGEDYRMQLETGKNALSWGEGYFYNAGDVIFGVSPKDRTPGTETDALRNYSIWQLRMFFPLGSFSYIETVVGVPEQHVYIPATSDEEQKTSALGITFPTTIRDAGGGIRTRFEIGSTQWETGFYSRFRDEDISPYVVFSLPLLVKWYVAASTKVLFGDREEQRRKTFEKTAAISTGIFSTISLAGAGTFTLRSEFLYRNQKIYTHLLLSYLINRVVGIDFSGECDFMESEYAFTVGPRWMPAEGCTLLFLAVARFRPASDRAFHEQDFYAGISLAFTYAF